MRSEVESLQQLQLSDQVSIETPSSGEPLPEALKPELPAEPAQEALAAPSLVKSASSESIKPTPEDFTFGPLLGEGSYSTVLLAHDSQLRPYAIKILEKSHIIKEGKVKYVKSEKDCLGRLKGGIHVIGLFHTFQDSTSLYFVLEYCKNGDLLGLLKEKGRFGVDGCRFYAAELVQAIEYIHAHGIIHRDVKPENVLLSEGFHIKMTDFGSAWIIGETGSSANIKEEKLGAPIIDRRSSFVGTAEYCSPELLSDQKCSFSTDIWAIGCIIFQMIVGIPPMKGSNEYQTFQKISKGTYMIPDEVDKDCTALIEKILIVDPKKRATMVDLKKDTFFKGKCFEDLHLTDAPVMEYMTVLQEVDVAPQASYEYFDTDSESTGSKELPETMPLPLPHSQLPTPNAWMPDFKKLGIQSSAVLKTDKAKLKKRIFFNSTRGLVLTSTRLYICDLKKEQVLYSLPLKSLMLQVKSKTKFNITYATILVLSSSNACDNVHNAVNPIGFTSDENPVGISEIDLSDICISEAGATLADSGLAGTKIGSTSLTSGTNHKSFSFTMENEDAFKEWLFMKDIEDLLGKYAPRNKIDSSTSHEAGELVEPRPAVASYCALTVRGLVKDQLYFYCTCGLSSTQPWCNNICSDTSFKQWVCKSKQTIHTLCNCKYSKALPFCDSSHIHLPLEIQNQIQKCLEDHSKVRKICEKCGFTPKLYRLTPGTTPGTVPDPVDLNVEFCKDK